MEKAIFEGVSINNSSSTPGHLMNSKAEYKQGQVARVVLVRGLGQWQAREGEGGERGGEWGRRGEGGEDKELLRRHCPGVEPGTGRKLPGVSYYNSGRGGGLYDRAVQWILEEEDGEEEQHLTPPHSLSPPVDLETIWPPSNPPFVIYQLVNFYMIFI